MLAVLRDLKKKGAKQRAHWLDRYRKNSNLWMEHAEKASQDCRDTSENLLAEYKRSGNPDRIQAKLVEYRNHAECLERQCKHATWHDFARKVHAEASGWYQEALDALDELDFGPRNSCKVVLIKGTNSGSEAALDAYDDLDSGPDDNCQEAHIGSGKGGLDGVTTIKVVHEGFASTYRLVCSAQIS